MITKVVVDNDPVNLNVFDESYNVVLNDDRISVEVYDVIIQDITEVEELYDIEVDTSVAGVTYVGQALPGTAKSEAKWRVKKITDSAGGASVDWANGTAEFIHVWNDHLSFTYGP